LLLILNVQTHWTSTHQMLWHALDYWGAVDIFITTHKELQDHYELSDEDWVAILMVTDWLKQFHLVTTKMSTTKTPMFSMMHATFYGLQQHFKEILTGLPDSTAPEIKQGLLDAHQKLSDYYYKFNASPFYIWAAHMCSPSIEDDK
ncbi:uncharacterized protein EV420DRAFT_1281402, partial [Desarmillaria tabescens]